MLPSLSVIVPSFNQAPFLEETLLSILDQNYPGLELILIDGGSTDGSIEIIKKYADRITYWVSEPDRGQSHAINKGLEKATGEWVAWMNSDDCYLPGALDFVFGQLPHQKLDFIYGTCTTGPDITNRVHKDFKKDHKPNLFQLLLFFHSTEHIIPSQSVFVRHTILAKTGLLDENLNYVMDLEWFARIFMATKRRKYYRYPTCFYRKHLATKTRNDGHLMKEEALKVSEKYLPKLGVWQQFKLRLMLKQEQAYRDHFFKARSFAQVMKLGLKFPVQCLHTRHFLPMLYRSVFPLK
jgi:glycosyltransferase involved in cell wall biosynthesis